MTAVAAMTATIIHTSF